MPNLLVNLDAEQARFFLLMNTDYQEIFQHTKRMVMRPFRSDCREVYVISNSYGMGDPLASRFREAGRTAEGGGVTSYH